MSADGSEDKKIMDLFMDDSTWINRIKKKEKKVEKQQKVEGEPEEIAGSSPHEESAPAIRHIAAEKKFIKEKRYETPENEATEKGVGEVDYAILKSITYGFKDIKQISGALQIRTMIVEKHVYALIKEGYLKFFQYAVITSKGKDYIIDFETNNPEDVWKPIDEFILAVIENKKERSVKMQKMIDLVLLIAMIVLIILIIYFGFFS
jgi:hypothetical protein